MPIWKQQLLSRLQSPASDGGDNGGGASSITPELQAIIDQEVAKAVDGLKNKNGTLIGETKQLKNELNEFKTKYAGIDPESVRNILSKFANDEEAALIAKGDIDTVLSKRTERMSTDFNKKLTDEASRATRAEAKAAKLADRTLAGALRDAAIKAGALPEALEDIVLRSRSMWRLSEDGDAVAMNGEEVVLGKDGRTPLSPSEWTESLRETASHLWPKAQGTGAPGNTSARTTSKTITRLQFDAMSLLDKAATAKAMGAGQLSIVD